MNQPAQRRTKKTTKSLNCTTHNNGSTCTCMYVHMYAYYKNCTTCVHVLTADCVSCVIIIATCMYIYICMYTSVPNTYMYVLLYIIRRYTLLLYSITSVQSSSSLSPSNILKISNWFASSGNNST